MKRAFSLAEMMIVLAVISILAGSLKVCVQHRRIQAEAKNIVEIVKIYEAALTMYYLRNGGNFPASSDGKYLEDVDALAAYRPTGFTTMRSVYSKKCTSIKIYDSGNWYGVDITIEGPTNSPLVNEVKKQLGQFAVSNQISGCALGPPCIYGIDTSEWDSTHHIFFYLKDNSNTYI